MASTIYRFTPLHIEDTAKVLVNSLKVNSDPELLASWALTAAIADLGLDLLTGEELQGLGDSGTIGEIHHLGPVSNKVSSEKLMRRA